MHEVAPPPPTFSPPYPVPTSPPPTPGPSTPVLRSAPRGSALRNDHGCKGKRREGLRPLPKC